MSSSLRFRRRASFKSQSSPSLTAVKMTSPVLLCHFPYLEIRSIFVNLSNGRADSHHQLVSPRSRLETLASARGMISVWLLCGVHFSAIKSVFAAFHEFFSSLSHVQNLVEILQDLGKILRQDLIKIFQDQNVFPANPTVTLAQKSTLESSKYLLSIFLQWRHHTS